MPNLATNGMILNLLLSVRQGENELPNIDFVKEHAWADIQAVDDSEVFGRGLFKRMDQAAYENGRANLLAANSQDIENDARVFTRSVETLMMNDDGEEPWDGPGPHPGNEQLNVWINALA